MTEASPDQQDAAPTPYDSQREADEPITLAVIDAVATVSGRPAVPGGSRSTSEGPDADALTPLHEAVDPDALETLCGQSDGRAQDETTITFTYCGYTVTVSSTGRVTVTESE